MLKIKAKIFKCGGGSSVQNSFCKRMGSSTSSTCTVWVLSVLVALSDASWPAMAKGLHFF